MREHRPKVGFTWSGEPLAGEGLLRESDPGDEAVSEPGAEGDADAKAEAEAAVANQSSWARFWCSGVGSKAVAT